jgi:hypothetical protein
MVMGLPLLTSSFRVLVLKNKRAEEPHQRIEAICLELNHGGRGATVPQALEDLAQNLEEYYRETWKEGAPAHYDPDPAWLEVFEKNLAQTKEGDLVVDRFRMQFTLERRQKSAKKRRPIRQIPIVSFEALVA